MSVTSLPGNSTRKEIPGPTIRAKIFTLVELHHIAVFLFRGLTILFIKKGKERKISVLYKHSPNDIP